MKEPFIEYEAELGCGWKDIYSVQKCSTQFGY